MTFTKLETFHPTSSHLLPIYFPPITFGHVWSLVQLTMYIIPWMLGFRFRVENELM
jgi:hypothetical protein